jgi:ATP-dependent exoDNAse (exonuclease V) alpha subunit
MAVYFLNLKSLGRSAGTTATAAAAYRAGERIRDERTGRTFDHSDRRDVLYKEILLPSRLADSAMGWAKDRAVLWNAAEAAESRKDARVAREYLIMLPHELEQPQRVALAREFAHELVERYGFALDLAMHAPRNFPGSDPRNFHAHLLASTREPTPSGFGAKTKIEWHDIRRRRTGLESGIKELLHVRARWAAVANAALEAAHLDARIDHRPVQVQGVGLTVLPATAASAASERPVSLEETRRRARESWLRLREAAADEAAIPEKPARDSDFAR